MQRKTKKNSSVKAKPLGTQLILFIHKFYFIYLCNILFER